MRAFLVRGGLLSKLEDPTARVVGCALGWMPPGVGIVVVGATTCV